jgi:hypothetical protein
VRIPGRRNGRGGRVGNDHAESFRGFRGGGTESVRSHMAPGRCLAGWATVTFRREQDDGMACGSRSRNSRRTLHAGSGTCAAVVVRAKRNGPPTVSSRAVRSRLRWSGGTVARPIKSVKSPRDFSKVPRAASPRQPARAVLCCDLSCRGSAIPTSGVGRVAAESDGRGRGRRIVPADDRHLLNRRPVATECTYCALESAALSRGSRTPSDSAKSG